MSLLNNPIIRPLELGEHTIQIVGEPTEKLATNGHEYLQLSIKVDNETFTRTKNLYEVEFNLFSVGVAAQVGYAGIDKGALLLMLKTMPFKVWLVQKTADGQMYTNWWYTKPQPKATITTVEAPEGVGDDL